MIRKIVVVFMVIGMLFTGSIAIAETCIINNGAYISHSKANIEELYNNVWDGHWDQARIMMQQGKLKKIHNNYNITPIIVNDKYVLFSISIAPEKEIWTLKMFTKQCN